MPSPSASKSALHSFDVAQIREDFPILQRHIYQRPLIYFDNAATTQKPKSVIDAETNVYLSFNSNIHRGVHCLSNQCTEAYENARKTLASFIHASHSREIIFTKGTTESVNLLATSFGNTFLKEGDEIIVSEMEHHSNIVPWQLLEQTKKITLKVIPVDDQGELRMETLSSLITSKTRLLAVTHVSNAMGIINPIREIIQTAHSHGIPVMIDGAQAIQHIPVDVQDLDCDFYAFSGHKLYGPTGTGVLYGKEKWLNQMIPYQGGGEMIQKVSFSQTTFNELPYKFEAGTPNFAGFIGLAAAIEYLQQIGLETIARYENELLHYAEEQLSQINGFRVIGQSKHKTGVISFLVGQIHPFDMGTMLDKIGIAVRTGHHCAQPLMDRFSIPGTVRASFAFYNTKEEIDQLKKGILKVQQMFG